VRDYRTLRLYAPAPCTVVGTRSVSTTTRGWVGARAFAREHSSPEVTVTYVVDGRRYTATGYDNYDGRMSDASELVSFVVGRDVSCWYDPASPQDAVVARQWSWPFYGSGLIPLVLTAIPLWFLVSAFRSQKATRQAADAEVDLTPAQIAAGIAAAALLLAGGLIAYVGYWVHREGLEPAVDHTGMFFLGLMVFDGYLFLMAWRSLRGHQPGSPGTVSHRKSSGRAKP